MAFQTLQVEAVEGFVKFYEIRSVTDQPAAHYQHGEDNMGREIGESEMNNLSERNQQPNLCHKGDILSF